MKPQPSSLSSNAQDLTILSAWREQVKQAENQHLRQQLTAHAPQLLPQFAGYYTRLQGLPRRARRCLQWRFRRERFTQRQEVRTARSTYLPRSLQRKWERSLAGVALLLTLGQAPALAATINVGAGCTLVNAITAANTDNAIGVCKAGSGADTIVLPANSTRTLTAVNNQYVGPSGLPIVTSTITIAGNGSTIARSSAAGTPQFRILVVGAGGNLTLRQTTVTGGSLPGDSRGGGVYRRSGTLTLIGCTISSNSAYLGGGVANSVGGTLIVTNSTVSGNTATGNQGGGGMFNNGNVANQDGILNVTNSTISGNKAKFGGGLRNDGTATITNSTIAGNSASGRFDSNAGGVANLFSGSLTLTNSTISGNSASNSGGGVNNYQGTVTLTNSTISGNSATNGGGALNGFGRMFFVDSTVSGNTATSQGGGVYSGTRVGNLRSDVVLGRTLISGNTAAKGAEVYQASGGVVTANNFNLFGHSGLTNAQALGGGGLILSGASDITATSDGTRPTALASILSLALANNGGLTQTHALAPGSPAIDAVATGCPPPANDQRGVPRPQDGNNDGIAQCDIGAFELAP